MAASARPTHDYTEADVLRWLNERTLRKAQGYEHAIRKLEVGPTHIHALVQGSAYAPYAVDIDFRRDLTNQFFVDMRCTCPVGHACKHAAVVLVAALARRGAQPAVNPAVLAWAESLAASARRPAAKPKAASSKSAGLHYVIRWSETGRAYELSILKGRFEGRTPTPGTVEWSNLERALVQPPQFVDDNDLQVLRALRRAVPRGEFWGAVAIGDALPGEALRTMLATGRLWYAALRSEWPATFPRETDYFPLHTERARPVTVAWEHNALGEIVARLATDPPAAQILPTTPPWYLDPARGEAGPLDCAGREALFQRLMHLPPLADIDVPIVAGALREACPELPAPVVGGGKPLREIDSPPVPVLALDSLQAWYIAPHRGYTSGWRADTYDYALPRFRYDDVTVSPSDPSEYFTARDGEAVRVKRRRKEEARFVESLSLHGFKPPPRGGLHVNAPLPQGLLGLESEARWARFFTDLAPALRAEGWEIEASPDFRHYVEEVESWEATVAEAEGGWLDVEMGIVVDGQRLPLAPLLHDLFRRDPRWLDAAALAQLADDESVVVHTPEGRRVRLDAARVKPIASTLIDLFDAPTSGALRVSGLEAARIADVAAAGAWRVEGAQTLTRLAERLKGTQGVQPVDPPAGFGLDLRAYQREGLAWLQYLREHELSGILADDMGLGKTAQTLAHLLMEKQAGRLDRPALVVLPTSLVFNWQLEAGRCAPQLRVLSLHGKARGEQFAHIPEHDMCLTTYPLLWRDEEALAAHEYHYLILDEAQMVKNAASRAAGVVRRLRARHRLCLTGTPLENHLGELWAQFDFLLPGFLGDAKRFTAQWRTPIEKHGDALRRELLARRVRPFILRRRKEDVAKELPPKTIIVRTVELEGGQRDLYETVRSAMDLRVREEIAARGFNRSQIVILDALLKLRQVCCDPRLLKTRAAEHVKERAKLSLLMDMLPELVAEGRRVLLFSQFTSMLELIQHELESTGIDYVLLTGDTRDRKGVISRFQDGKAPVFLISLKAGGVGLNLTAADTVIHFDPWWNPAVESQATDRAHRIGQTQRVFVYKLVVAGSIEEKILALQDKKAELAAGVLSEDSKALAKFGEADIRALLEPLPVRR